jgi:hypothetical protein
MTDAGAGLLVVIVEVEPGDEDELNRWYDTEHIPEKLATPGFRSARRFRDVGRPGRYLAVYELDDPAVVTSPEYMAQAMSPWSDRVMATWVSLDRSVWEVVASGGAETGAAAPDGADRAS